MRITDDVRVQLGSPPLASATWEHGIAASGIGVSVPEATSYFDNLLANWKDYVRTSRQVSAMQPVAVALLMQQSSNQDFGLGVYPSYGLHVGSPRRADIIEARPPVSDCCFQVAVRGDGGLPAVGDSYAGGPNACQRPGVSSQTAI